MMPKRVKYFAYFDIIRHPFPDFWLELEHRAGLVDVQTHTEVRIYCRTVTAPVID